MNAPRGANADFWLYSFPPHLQEQLYFPMPTWACTGAPALVRRRQTSSASWRISTVPLWDYPLGNICSLWDVAVIFQRTLSPVQATWEVRNSATVVLATIEVQIHEALPLDLRNDYSWQDGIILPFVVLLQHGYGVSPGTDDPDAFSNYESSPAVPALFERRISSFNSAMNDGRTGHEFPAVFAPWWKHRIRVHCPDFHLLTIEWIKGRHDNNRRRPKLITTWTIVWRQHMNGQQLSLYPGWALIALVASAMCGEDVTNRRGMTDHRSPISPAPPPVYSPATPRDPDEDTELAREFSPTSLLSPTE